MSDKGALCGRCYHVTMLQLAEDLGVSEGDQVLVAVFAPGRDMTSRPQGRSGICAYSLQHIDTLFDQVLLMMITPQ